MKTLVADRKPAEFQHVFSRADGEDELGKVFDLALPLPQVAEGYLRGSSKVKSPCAEVSENKGDFAWLGVRDSKPASRAPEPILRSGRDVIIGLAIEIRAAPVIGTVIVPRPSQPLQVAAARAPS